MYRIEQITPDWDDEIVVEVNAFENAWRSELDPDSPPLPASTTRAHLGLREEARLFAARDEAGTVVGTAWLDVPDHDRHLAFAVMATASAHRRRAVGTKLLGAATEYARADSRRQIVLGCDYLNPSADAFAASLGANVGLRAHINRLVIADVDPARMLAWSDAGTDEYVVEWAPDGGYPDDWLVAMAGLHTVLLNDAPMDDLPVEHRSITVDELRAKDKALAGYGKDRWTLVARCRETGHPVGYTELILDPTNPATLHQGATAVDRHHRGHALGRRLKAEMFRRVLKDVPEAKFIRTFNADSNAPMLAVNADMGFEPLLAARRWVLDTADVEKWLERRR